MSISSISNSMLAVGNRPMQAAAHNQVALNQAEQQPAGKPYRQNPPASNTSVLQNNNVGHVMLETVTAQSIIEASSSTGTVPVKRAIEAYTSTNKPLTLIEQMKADFWTKSPKIDLALSAQEIQQQYGDLADRPKFLLEPRHEKTKQVYDGTMGIKIDPRFTFDLNDPDIRANGKTLEDGTVVITAERAKQSYEQLRAAEESLMKDVVGFKPIFSDGHNVTTQPTDNKVVAQRQSYANTNILGAVPVPRGNFLDAQTDKRAMDSERFSPEVREFMQQELELYEATKSAIRETLVAAGYADPGDNMTFGMRQGKPALGYKSSFSFHEEAKTAPTSEIANLINDYIKDIAAMKNDAYKLV